MRHKNLLGQTAFLKATLRVMTEGFLKPNAKTAFLKLFSSSVPPINYSKRRLFDKLLQTMLYDVKLNYMLGNVFQVYVILIFSGIDMVC